MAESLLPFETDDLERCETVVANGLHTFIEVGTALLEIRDKALYRSTHKNFAEYCRERWGIARSTAYQLMEAAEVVENVRNCGQGLPLPATESQARPLTSLEPEQQREAWSEAVATAPNGKPTAKHVEEVAARYRPEPEPDRRTTTTGPGPGLFVDDDAESRETDEETEPEESREQTSRDDTERLREKFMKSLDYVDDITRAADARVRDGGYGGLDAIMERLGRKEQLRLLGKTEIMLDRLRGWRSHIKEKMRKDRVQ